MARLLDAVVQALQAVQDVYGGKLIAWVIDADGNITGFVKVPKGHQRRHSLTGGKTDPYSSQ